MMTKLNWYYKGIIFGIFVLISNSAIDFLAGDFTFDGIGKKIILSLISGLLLGLLMKYIDNKKTE
ncbi:hypothetical protein Q4512_14075 [Oceanihabitans sp. 2_MG-2023]|uniref:hypothetical protein n=1 Tax=Oceanihabitans sp. 2_MG-2023 TaxID=3062661 RepID=UPI0026E1AB47|nr:hypothetical protein [Oceanihabitans sp. 2_MG-2023]MDO6598046.1 hypothetical protein [Oceanihabitans sp. 2_MG-2023]